MVHHHPATRISVTVDAELLGMVDAWVAAGRYPNRSRAVHAALQRLRDEQYQRTSILAELAKLEPAEERALAEEWLVGETPWPQC